MNSINSSPNKRTVVIANPLFNFTRVNSTNAVAVNALVVVSGLNGANSVQTFFTKNQVFQPSGNTTPGFLQITNVNLPSQGPYMVQVFLESAQCTVFPQLPVGYSFSVGDRAKYFSTRSKGIGSSNPARNYIMPSPNNTSGDCCN